MKYFVLGALASGMLLYGMSMLYGATGSLELEAVSAALAGGLGSSNVLAFGLVFVVAGIAFKLGAAPFHMWVPDVYQGAPTSVTLFVGSAPKIAAFAFTLRLLVNGMEPLVADWQGMLLIAIVYGLGFLWCALLALLATKAGRKVGQSSAMRWFEGAMGVGFFGLAGRLALARNI